MSSLNTHANKVKLEIKSQCVCIVYKWFCLYFMANYASKMELDVFMLEPHIKEEF